MWYIIEHGKEWKKKKKTKTNIKMSFSAFLIPGLGINNQYNGCFYIKYYIWENERKTSVVFFINFHAKHRF